MKKMWITGLAVLSAWFCVAAPVKIACVGDSITYGYGLADRATESYPAVLQTLLGTNCVVRNFGNSGRGIYRHSLRGNEPRGYHGTAEYAASLAWQPDIVICNLGINDCGEYLICDGKTTAADQSLFAKDYLTLLASYQALPSHPRLVIWTKLAPLGVGQRFEKSPEPVMMQRDLSYVAQRVGAVELDMDTPLRSVLATHFPDKLHPDATGARMIATTTAVAVKPLVRVRYHVTRD